MRLEQCIGRTVEIIYEDRNGDYAAADRRPPHSRRRAARNMPDSGGMAAV
ncbi:hypothetical protein [Paenibacillus melissococcoides]